MTGKAVVSHKTKPMSIKHRLFCMEYLKDFNATQAYIRAGYSAKNAQPASSVLLSNPMVQAEIARLSEDAVAAAGINVVRLLREANEIALSDISQAFDPETGALLQAHKMPKSALAALASVKVVEMAGGMAVKLDDGSMQHVPLYSKEVKLWDKPGAIFKLLEYVNVAKNGPRPNVELSVTNNTLVVQQANDLMNALGWTGKTKVVN